jgi:hypothetical protein
MAERIDNPWWSEGWRLVRERLPELLRDRRRGIFIGVAVGATVGGLLLAVLAAVALELAPAPRTVAFVIVEAGAAVGAALAVAVWIFARRDRSRAPREGGVSLSLGAIYDLSRPLTGVTAADRATVTSSIAQQRRELPDLIVGSLFFVASFVLMWIGALAAGVGGLSAWLWLVWSFVFFLSSPFMSLKVLGNTTPILERLDATGEPPTYLGPKGWKIEAPRNAPGEDATPG